MDAQNKKLKEELDSNASRCMFYVLAQLVNPCLVTMIFLIVDLGYFYETFKNEYVNNLQLL